jgi:hypothetical protein
MREGEIMGRRRPEKGIFPKTTGSLSQVTNPTGSKCPGSTSRTEGRATQMEMTKAAVLAAR